MNFPEIRKVVVTGGAGFLGRHVVDSLLKKGVRKDAVLVPRSSEHDLRDARVCRDVIEGADLVIHLAARVGGIGFNQKHPGELFYDNSIMGINLIEASRQARVKKFLMTGTICSYPFNTPVPFEESYLWNGYPEITNAPYGIAKKSLLVMLDAYRQQYGLNGVFLLPVNLYGPWDNFDLENAHVIPALIRKFYEAKRSSAPEVTLWGDGSPTREFLFVRDAAFGIVEATEKYDGSEPVNLGSAEEISVRDLATLISKKVGYQGKVIWDTSRPNGQLRRKLDTSRAKNLFGFQSSTSFSDGLDETIRWWEENRPN